jgi:hypothetical protein
MFTSRRHVVVGVMAILALFFGAVREGRAGVVESKRAPECRDLPVIKNLTGLRARHVCDRMAVPWAMTKGEVKKLAATAKSADDHLTIAQFYRAEANGLDAKATGYELAAARLRNAAFVKNFAAPGTASRYEFVAQGFREEAQADRGLATSHEEMAKTVVASIK